MTREKLDTGLQRLEALFGYEIFQFASREEWASWRHENPAYFNPTEIATARDSILKRGVYSAWHGLATPSEVTCKSSNLREGLLAKGANPRQRAILDLLAASYIPHDRDIKIYAPEAVTSFAKKVGDAFPGFIGSEYIPYPRNERERLIRHEDLSSLTFVDNQFDLVISNDIFEHLPDLHGGLAEICRVLRPSGALIATFPFATNRETTSIRAVLNANGEVNFLADPEYHGNPIDPKNGSLVFQIPGWDIIDYAHSAGFKESKILLLSSIDAGIITNHVKGMILFIASKEARTQAAGEPVSKSSSQMIKDFSNIRTQWGSIARGFGSYTDEERRSLVSCIARFCCQISESTGIPIFLSYGGLLGAIRSEKLIDHDFDIDVIFCSDEGQTEQTCRNLISYLLSLDAELNVETNGQFKASLVIDGQLIRLEFFAGWTSQGRFYQYFAVPGTISADQVFPLGEITLEGATLPAPKNPLALLEAIYGKNWMTPDPDFKYNLSPEDWRPFEFLFVSRMKTFWDDYYAKPGIQRVYVSDPSPYAITVEELIPSNSCILEIGCGNGRDTLHFAMNGHNTKCVDYSSAAIESLTEQARINNVRIDAQVLNISSIVESVAFGRKHMESFDVVYARFFTHAIDDLALFNFFDLSYSVLKRCGRIYIEYRALPSGVDEFSYSRMLKYENGDHFRKLRPKHEMDLLICHANFKLVESLTGHGLAVWKDEDPLVGRIIAEKPA